MRNERAKKSVTFAMMTCPLTICHENQSLINVASKWRSVNLKRQLSQNLRILTIA